MVYNWIKINQKNQNKQSIMLTEYKKFMKRVKKGRNCVDTISDVSSFNQRYDCDI